MNKGKVIRRGFALFIGSLLACGPGLFIGRLPWMKSHWEITIALVALLAWAVWTGWCKAHWESVWEGSPRLENFAWLVLGMILSVLIVSGIGSYCLDHSVSQARNLGITVENTNVEAFVDGEDNGAWWLVKLGMDPLVEQIRMDEARIGALLPILGSGKAEPADLAEAKGLLARGKPLLRYFDKASRAGRFVPGEGPLLVDTPAGIALQGIDLLIKIAVLDVEISRRKKRWDQAGRRVEQLLWLANQLHGRHHQMYDFSAFSCRRAAMRAAARLIPHLPASRLSKAWSEQLAGYSSQMSWQGSMARELVWNVVKLGRSKDLARTIAGPGFKGVNSTSSVVENLLLRLYKPWIAWDSSWTLRRHTAVLVCLRKPWLERRDCLAPINRPGWLLGTVSAPARWAEGDAALRSDLAVKLLKLGLELKKYHEMTGAWPSGLDKLNSDLPAVLTHDPFSGLQLIYRKERKKIIVYSVGPNGEDDGGVWSRVKDDVGLELRL